MTEQQQAAMRQALELLTDAHVTTDLVWKRHDCCEALRRALEQQPKKPTQSPYYMMNPKADQRPGEPPPALEQQPAVSHPKTENTAQASIHAGSVSQQPAGEPVACEEQHPNNRLLFKRLCAAAGIGPGKETIASALDKVIAIKQQAAAYIAICECLEKLGFGVFSRAPSTKQIAETCEGLGYFYTRPQPAAPDEADELLRHLGLDPQTYRTDGGAINRMKVKAALAHPNEYPRTDSMEAMVNRFLSWPVPASVYPDGTPGQPGRTGTNLLTVDEARQMLEHVIAPQPAAQWVGLTDAEIGDAIKQSEQVKTDHAGWVREQRLIWGRAIESKLREKNS